MVAVRGFSRKACSGEQSGLFELRPPLAIAVRPPAAGLARRKFARIPIIIKALYQAVDPAEAERLTNAIVIRYALAFSVRFEIDQPDAAADCVISLEPLAPRAPMRYFKQLHSDIILCVLWAGSLHKRTLLAIPSHTVRALCAGKEAFFATGIASQPATCSSKPQVLPHSGYSQQ
ncbi:MAG TPA: hypothetical protein VKT72_05680 [Candidatus Baltobacteraceae bacterium]|nr:hypothetical protein [Candidatus Baltobacteraceae bacterium]